MVSYQIFYTKKALEDIPKLKSAKLDTKAKNLILLIKSNPYQNPPPYEKLKGILQGAYSRRINIKHRLVYEIIEESKVIKIISLWTHYEF
ncbi:Txe/YoeB family addiction module toxin [Helicobacter brantae]|uniref:Putative mRNA interferase YoeB n=1 Tax=Helicobacter brantae TaxID=375927 RepID=A0A3D8J114_9HELI|nr:Txe/YoeB family addiction module toxin [Helicobacter brantae]